MTLIAMIARGLSIIFGTMNVSKAELRAYVEEDEDHDTEEITGPDFTSIRGKKIAPA